MNKQSLETISDNLKEINKEIDLHGNYLVDKRLMDLMERITIRVQYKLDKLNRNK